MAQAVSTLAEAAAFERLLGPRFRELPKEDVDRMQTAFADASQWYEGMMHRTGVSTMRHCLGVLEMYLAFEPDADGVIACLLHHVMDTKKCSLDELEERYGPTVRSIVSGVHLLSHVTGENRRMSLEQLRSIFVRVSDDIRVVLLMLCDHCYKLAHLDDLALKMDDRRQLCLDVLQVFAPVAARLGIYSLKHQMESIAFPEVYPVDARRIHDQLKRLHSQYGDFLEQTAHTVQIALAEAGVDAQVELREKQPFSIFQKMRMKSLSSVEDVYDLFALRVIVPDNDTCYQTLGVLHRIGHPVANRFKDYIAFPKPNGYQSLHTTLAQLPGVPEGVFVEIQIRTPAMHREADLGIAAHWSYKEGGGRAQYAAQKAQLQRALTLQEEEDEISDEHDDRIFALTPNGDIVELPEGATPLDFAFHVHSMVGLCFRAARVNGNIAPITYQLENGDIVEILKHKEPRPSANWMQLLKTASARAQLRRYLLSHERPVNLVRGREALNDELAKHHLAPLDPDLSILRSFDGSTLPLSSREDLLVKIGQGAQNASSLLPHLDALSLVLKKEEETPRNAPAIPGSLAVKLEGNIPMPLKFARCCKPDEHYHGAITGVIGRDGSVRIHRSMCNLLKNANPERQIRAWWA